MVDGTVPSSPVTKTFRVLRHVLGGSVEGFNEAVVGRLARSREVEHHTLLVGPEVDIAGDELRSLVDADGLGVAHGFADALQGQPNIFASIAEARIDGGREAAKGIDDRQHADLASGGEPSLQSCRRSLGSNSSDEVSVRHLG